MKTLSKRIIGVSLIMAVLAATQNVFAQLEPCPSKPTGVSSEPGTDPKRLVKPLPYVSIPELVLAVKKQIPRASVVKRSESYLHVEVRSRLFGFVDDLELRLDEYAQKTQVRSASRVGYYDFGVNRKRVEALRAYLLSGKTD
jgi:uncharacterized protein (DUF1499 family)